jgi:hypothetical protein
MKSHQTAGKISWSLLHDLMLLERDLPGWLGDCELFPPIGGSTKDQLIRIIWIDIDWYPLRCQNCWINWWLSTYMMIQYDDGLVDHHLKRKDTHGGSTCYVIHYYIGFYEYSCLNVLCSPSEKCLYRYYIYIYLKLETTKQTTVILGHQTLILHYLIMVWCTISDLSDTSGPTPAGRQERQATKRSEKHWQNLTILLAHATCATSHAQVALDMCHMSQRDQAQWNSHINESRMSTPHKGSSCSAGN